MEINIRSTGQITRISGAECRVWEGVTAAGIPCRLFVHRIAAVAEADLAEFERELIEQLPPVEAVVSLPSVLRGLA